MINDQRSKIKSGFGTWHPVFGIWYWVSFSMSNEQNENQEASPGAPGKNPERGGSAALDENLELGIENLGEKGGEGLPQALVGNSRQAGVAPAKAGADPFFSGRKHFPALDGLRAIAVIAVISLHVRGYMGLKIPESGGVFARFIFTASHHGAWGVDLFFVLSGFLITGILVDARNRPHYFRNFYARRTLRIFPLYYGTLLCLLVLTPLILGRVPAALEAGYKYQFWLWTYTTNVKDCISGQVFSNFSQFWTLAIEEQFYLVWPLVILLVPRKRLLLAIGALVVAINIWRLGFWFSHSHIIGASDVWVWIFAFTPFRADALLAGAALAVMRSERALEKARPILMALFPISSLVTFCCYFGLSRRYGWAPDALMTQVTMAPFVLGSLMGIVLTSSPGSWVVKALSVAPLRTVAKYSYAMYVFHLIYLREQCRLLPFPTMVGALHSVLLGLIAYYAYGIGVALVFAFASYHLYEKHFLKLKKYFPERAAAASSFSTDH